MRHYFNTILIAAILLLLFPFLGFPELWENIYVAVLAFVVGYTAMLLRHKSGLVKKDDPDARLQDYVKELQEKFTPKNPIQPNTKKKGRVADIKIEENES